MFSFLNFSFDSPIRDGRESSKASNKNVDCVGNNWRRSDSNTTSPTSSAGTPKRIPLLCTPPPMKPPRQAPSARPAVTDSPRGSKGGGYHGVRKRRSSIFFKLPDIDKVRKGKGDVHRNSSSGGSKTKIKSRDALGATTAAAEGQLGGEYEPLKHSNNPPAKHGRPASRRRNRRASVAPGGGSPIRTRALRSPFGATAAAEDSLQQKKSSCVEDLSVGPAAAAAAAAAAAVAAEGFCSEDPRSEPRGGGGQLPLAALAEDSSVVLISSPKPPPPTRASPRALSAGHRYFYSVK